MPEPQFDRRIDSWINPKLEPNLSGSVDELSKKFNNLQNPEDLASLLEIPIGQLNYIAYTALPKYYDAYRIPKKSGDFRTIHAPKGGLLLIQRKIKQLAEPYYRVKKPVYGFIKGQNKGIKENAAEHRKKRILISIDLEDYFGTIHFGRVAGIFMSYPFNMAPKVANLIAQLCCFQKKLPQGAPTSPLLSNLAASELDKEMVKLAKRMKCNYTRYADDMTLSTNLALPKGLAEENISADGTLQFTPTTLLTNTIEKCGFKINNKKFRVRKKNERQEVTGLTVNQRPNISKKYYRETRAMIHNFMNNPKKAESEFLAKYKKVEHSEISTENLNGDTLKNHIYGRLSFFKAIKGENDSAYIKMCIKMANADSSPPKFILRIKKETEMYDVFICHASEDKDKFAKPLYDELANLGIHAFLDTEAISWGDSLVSIINTALAKSKYVVAVLSEDSVKKAWPLKEINSVLAQEISKSETKLLPLVCGNEENILNNLPLLSDKLYKTAKPNEMKDIALSILELLEKQKPLKLQPD